MSERFRLHAGCPGDIDRDEVLTFTHFVNPAHMRYLYRSARRGLNLSPMFARALVIGRYVVDIWRP